MLSEKQKEKIQRFSRFSRKEIVVYLDMIIRKQKSGAWTKPFCAEESDMITGVGLPMFFGDETGLPCPWRDDAFLLPLPGATADHSDPSNTAWVCFGPERGTAVTEYGEPMNCGFLMLKHFENNAAAARKSGTLEVR